MKMENLVGIGIALITVGFVAVFIGALSSKESDAKIAVGGFIGFIPFGFGNDKGMVWFVAVISAVILISSIILNSRVGK